LEESQVAIKGKGENAEGQWDNAPGGKGQSEKHCRPGDTRFGMKCREFFTKRKSKGTTQKRKRGRGKGTGWELVASVQP